MATLAYGGLNAVIVSSGKITKHQQLISSVQRTILFFEQDMRQLSPRPRFTEHETYIPALEVIENNTVLMTFSRGGVYSPGIVSRSSLQRVAYKLNDKGELIRQAWPYVDYLAETKIVEQVLLEDVESIKIKLLDSGNRWQKSWGRQGVDTLPKAISIEINHKDLGLIRRLIAIYQ